MQRGEKLREREGKRGVGGLFGKFNYKTFDADRSSCSLLYFSLTEQCREAQRSVSCCMFFEHLFIFI